MYPFYNISQKNTLGQDGRSGPYCPYRALVLKVLRERNLEAPRAIRLLIKILTWLILQLSKEAITTYKKLQLIRNLNIF